METRYPLMSDGRNFTNWQPVALVNETIRRREHLNTDMEYRAYLQSNANSIRLYNLSLAQNQVSNFPTVSYDHRVGPPHLFEQRNEPPAPTEGKSDLKDWFFNLFKKF